MMPALGSVPNTVRFLPRTGDRSVTQVVPSLRAEVNALTAHLVALQREQRIQFERIAQIQAQLDALTSALGRLIDDEPRRPRRRRSGQ